MTSLARWVLACAGLLALAVAAAPATYGSRTARCFAAAAHDPEHPCRNPALDHTVIPSEGVALLTPNGPCAPIHHARPFVCAFGPGASTARRRFASIGDSHSDHWRAALTVVARMNHWHGYQLYQTSCPFSFQPTVLRPVRYRQCERWRHDVVTWMGTHPEIDTVFVSEHRVHIAVPPGVTRLDAEINGYIAAWNALPATVRHIVVIRDTPYNRLTTNDCIRRAVQHRRRPGIACEVPIAHALRPDPAAMAARRLQSSRVRVVDMTRYMCGSHYCYPVIGGVRVHKDDDHLTRIYSASLGPYLRREIARRLHG
jgi:hypothetical protein